MCIEKIKAENYESGLVCPKSFCSVAAGRSLIFATLIFPAMYHIPPFKEEDSQKIFAFMQAHPFAMLTVNGPGWPAVTQVPLFLENRDGKILIRGHIMKKTAHHLAMQQTDKILFLFAGAHSYVSASWYKEPAVASTWNYSAVQAQCSFSFLDDEGLKKVLNDTTAFFEKDADSPAAFQNLPESYVQQHMAAIIAFEAEVQNLKATFKWSQNRDEADFANIIAQLDKGDAGSKGVAAAMKDFTQQTT